MTRLSYCFLNPLHWLSGTPVVVGVVRRKPNTQTNVPDRAYSVGLQYPSGIVYSLLAGYLRPLHGTPMERDLHGGGGVVANRSRGQHLVF